MRTPAVVSAAALRGPRLRLRPWRDADLLPFARLNADPWVMRHMPARLAREESDALAARFRAHHAEHGWGFWVVEPVGGPSFAGTVGLQHVPWQAPFTPAVEIGWRIVPALQRQGLAEAAARLALGVAFASLGLDRVVSFTVPKNEPSWRLMEKLGMREGPGFDHPALPEEHRLRRHLLYTLDRTDWAQT